MNWILAHHRDGLATSVLLGLILDSSVSLWVGIQSVGDWVRILATPEEENVSPFNSKTLISPISWVYCKTRLVGISSTERKKCHQVANWECRYWPTEPCFNIKTVFQGPSIPIIKIRDTVILAIGIPVSVRRHIQIETTPRLNAI